MAITFKERRRLLSGDHVEPGIPYTFSPEEEQAYVNNGDAVYVVEAKPTTKPTKGEDIDHG